MAVTEIVSWNVNGIRSAAKHGFLKWLSEESPDIVCLQETKCQAEHSHIVCKDDESPKKKRDLDDTILKPFGYRSYWASAEKKGYSGVAIYTKKEPLSVDVGLGVSDFDSEGRTLIADYGDFTLINCYFPNSRRDHSRLGYKIEFCDKIFQVCKKLSAQKKKIVLCGDINIAHKEIDLRNPKTNQDNAGFLPEERAWLDKFLAKDFIDTFREFNQEAGHYTWWSHRPGVREKNVGWRLDYHFINQALRPYLKKALIHPDVFGSDHCPVSIQLKF